MARGRTIGTVAQMLCHVRVARVSPRDGSVTLEWRLLRKISVDAGGRITYGSFVSWLKPVRSLVPPTERDLWVLFEGLDGSEYCCVPMDEYQVLRTRAGLPQQFEYAPGHQSPRRRLEALRQKLYENGRETAESPDYYGGIDALYEAIVSSNLL